eukprot:3540023-Prymnesium_polylepis.1
MPSRICSAVTLPTASTSNKSWPYVAAERPPRTRVTYTRATRCRHGTCAPVQTECARSKRT